MIRARFKQAVIKILTKLQAYNIYEKIKRNKHCVIAVNKFVKDYHPIKNDNAQYGGVSAKQTDKGLSIAPSEESEEVFDDEIQSSSEGSINEDNLNSARKGSNAGGSEGLAEEDGDQKVVNVMGKSDI